VRVISEMVEKEQEHHGFERFGPREHNNVRHFCCIIVVYDLAKMSYDPTLPFYTSRTGVACCAQTCRPRNICCSVPNGMLLSFVS
jgi:hypothetical protein